MIYGKGNGRSLGKCRRVVLRESSVVLGSLASGALSPSGGEAPGSGPLAPAARSSVVLSTVIGRMRRHYPFPFPGECRGIAGNRISGNAPTPP